MLYASCLIVAKKYEELEGQKGGKKDKTPQKPQQQQDKKQEKKQPEPKKTETPPQAKPVICAYSNHHLYSNVAHFSIELLLSAVT